MMNKHQNRRAFIGHVALLTGALMIPDQFLFAADKKNTYKIAVIDLMILKRQKISALPLAKEIGADGLEIDMGGLGNRETFDNKLADPKVRQEYLDKAKELNLEICSLAMTGFYAQSFATRPTYQKMIQDCLDTAKAMNVKVVFLPLGVQGDLIKNPELRGSIIDRLKIAGKMASKNIRSYFNFSNAIKNGRDLHQELRILGKKNIIQIHATNEDGVWLQNDKKIDLNKVKETLDDMGWKGWLVVERSRDESQPTNVKYNFSANTSYLKSIFQTK